MRDSLKRTIGITIGVLLLITIGYILLIPSKVKYFQTIDIPRTSVTINKTKISYLDTIVHAGLNILEIDTVFVTIRKISATSKIEEQELDILAHIIGDGNSFIIFITETKSRSEHIDIIAHELIHLKQYIDGELILFDEHGIIYKYDEWEDIRNIKYEDRLWEIDAFREGPILADKIKDKLYIKK